MFSWWDAQPESAARELTRASEVTERSKGKTSERSKVRFGELFSEDPHVRYALPKSGRSKGTHLPTLQERRVQMEYRFLGDAPSYSA
jgi:hypothetical protein